MDKKDKEEIEEMFINLEHKINNNLHEYELKIADLEDAVAKLKIDVKELRNKLQSLGVKY